ncbi:MAG: DUF3106 domain-containing protein [Burkholderiales bacterium]
MTPRANRWLPGSRRGAVWGVALVLCAGLWGTSSIFAQAPTAPAAARTAATPEQGVRWRDLKPGQQAVLKPLEREWPKIGTLHKEKWLELSGDFAKRSPDEQARIQARMTEWARLTPQQRSQARLNFQEAKQLPATDRKARWDAYQALPPEKKQQLAARGTAPAASQAAARPSAQRGDAQAKSNVVPDPTNAASRKVIAPTVVQARPGATTTPITKRPMPPTHQQTGLPKIAATPGFVDKSTLLPQRGPQGAATRSAAASAPGTAVAR